jgi:hypothetical protein
VIFKFELFERASMDSVLTGLKFWVYAPSFYSFLRMITQVLKRVGVTIIIMNFISLSSFVGGRIGLRKGTSRTV